MERRTDRIRSERNGTEWIVAVSPVHFLFDGSDDSSCVDQSILQSVARTDQGISRCVRGSDLELSDVSVPCGYPASNMAGGRFRHLLRTKPYCGRHGTDDLRNLPRHSVRQLDEYD